MQSELKLEDSQGIICKTCNEEYSQKEILEMLGYCYSGWFICNCGETINLKNK